MPEISRFLGIVIRMYYREHQPPHFYARYGDYEVVHRGELLEDWALAAHGRPLRSIAPLE